jgi:hypothetical protein
MLDNVQHSGAFLPKKRRLKGLKGIQKFVSDGMKGAYPSFS